MAYSSKNVIVGAAAVFLSEKDSNDPTFFPSGGKIGIALPALSAGTSAAVTLESDAAWRNAGYTTDGVEVSYEPDFGEVTVDQELDVVKIFKQGMRVSVNTTFAEATLENLMIAWGQASNTITGTDSTDKVLTISGGVLHDDPVERSLAFVGKAPRTTGKRERVYYVRRALQVEASSHSLSRTDATTIPVSFRLLPETGVSGSDYGTVTDRTVT